MLLSNPFLTNKQNIMNSIKCPSCRLTDWADAKECKRCGYLYQGNPQEYQTVPNDSGNQPTQNFGQNQSNYQTQNNHSSNPYQTNNYPPPNYQSANYGQTDYRQPHYQPHYGHQPYADQKSGMAITSMILGILGIAPIGLILGIISLRKANKNPQEYGGKGFAIAGIALSAVTILFIPMIAAIAIPNLMAARRAANEGSAISTLRTIYGAESTYMATGGRGACGSLSDLIGANLLGQNMGSGEKSGYRFTVEKLPGGCEINAVPISRSTGTRSFLVATDEGNIRMAAKNGSPATRSDPFIDSNASNYAYPPKIAVR